MESLLDNHYSAPTTTNSSPTPPSSESDAASNAPVRLHRSRHPHSHCLSTVAEVVAELAAGRFVIVMDSVERENEADLVMAARYATPERVAFAVRHTTGILCAPMEERRAETLHLPQMVPAGESTDPKGTAFTVTVDSTLTGTGVSAEDRAKTLVSLASLDSVPGDFRRPGHVFPLVARDGGVLERGGHTEATVELCKLAGIDPPVGLIAELVNSNAGTMQRLVDCLGFAKRHRLKVITVEQLASAARGRRASQSVPNGVEAGNGTGAVELVAECKLPISIRGEEEVVEWAVKCFHAPEEGLYHGEAGIFITRTL
jgi:3,4-dihydroxy-2-butanone 4-phosphate synthase